MKIVFSPKLVGSNKYVDIIINGLANREYEVFSLSELFSSYRIFFDVKIIHLNWFENISSIGGFLSKFFVLTTLFLFRKRIIWTIHNKQPHSNEFPVLSKIIMTLLLALSSRIIIHSHETNEVIKTYGHKYLKKTIYIPHPNYVGIYGEAGSEKKRRNDERLKLLFIGSVSPYKNIELLIDTVNRLGGSVLLTIAGRPVTSQYKKSISDRVGENKSIELDLRYIEDNKIGAMIAESDLLVLPYNTESSLNSGTVLLAFSYGRTVVCPAIGTILDYDSLENVLIYNYISEQDHREALFKTLQRAIDLHKGDKDIFERWGQEMLKIVEKNNSQDLIVEQYSQLYQSS